MDECIHLAVEEAKLRRMALNPGHTLLNGQYRIVSLLGRGGFGFVYLAHDTVIDEQVATKELIPALVGDQIVLKRFLAEAKATMKLRHKRIVATHNVFHEGENYYIVMEYMPGGSLEDRLRAKGSLPVDECVRIAVQVCEGLACAHEEGVVHCDLKPANILFAADGSAKVADFGIAHISEQILSRSWMTPAGFVAGTLPYMSPEQADGVRDDPRVDIYAVGAVLFRMLTGRTYLDFNPRDTPGAQADNVNRIRDQAPAPPSSYSRSAPLWLDSVVLKALAKQPEDRYVDVGQIRTALQHGEDAMATAHRVGPPPSVSAISGDQQQPATHTTRAPPGSPNRSVRQPMLDSKRRVLAWSIASAAASLLVILVIVAILGSGRGNAVTPTASVPVLIPLATTATLVVSRTSSPAPPTVTLALAETSRPAITRTLVPTEPLPTNTPTARCTQWNLASDFRRYPVHENPNRDSCGNVGVWHFMQGVDLARKPGNYTLLPRFTENAGNARGIEAWQGNYAEPRPNTWVPCIGVNATGAPWSQPGIPPFAWPPDVVTAHPAPTQLVVVGWRSPFSGTVAISANFADLDSYGGDGVTCYIDKGAENLASRLLPNGKAQEFTLKSVTIDQGEFIYFIVDPNRSYLNDTTELAITIVRLDVR